MQSGAAVPDFFSLDRLPRFEPTGTHAKAKKSLSGVAPESTDFETIGSAGFVQQSLRSLEPFWADRSSTLEAQRRAERSNVEHGR